MVGPEYPGEGAIIYIYSQSNPLYLSSRYPLIIGFVFKILFLVGPDDLT